MIARADTPARRGRFRSACREVPYYGAILPLEHALFGRSQPGRFYAGPTLALDLGSRTAVALGHANPEELAGFLAFGGVERLIADGPAPAGWGRDETLRLFGLGAGRALPLPPAEEKLWAALTRNDAPRPMDLAKFLYPQDTAQRDDFYSALCTKRSRGVARAWTLEEAGEIRCTVGAYALWGGEAALACGMTDPALRGQGIGGRLIVGAANALAAEGYRVSFLCREERVHFYTRLGFEPLGALALYTPGHTEP